MALALALYVLASAIIIGAVIVSIATDRFAKSLADVGTSVDTALSALATAQAQSGDATLNAAADQLDAINANITTALAQPASPPVAI